MRIFGNWYLVKDTGIPKNYPPKAREELVRRRLEGHELTKRIYRERLIRGVHLPTDIYGDVG